MNWTSEQVLLMAPDSGVAKDAQKLAASGKWTNLNRSERAVWGECQGSGKDPYKVQIDLQETAFKCTCPSRKIPCKHAIALALRLVDQPGQFGTVTPPQWVVAWLEGRDKRSTPKVEKPVDEAAQAKRAAKRESKVNAGIQELDLWLRDAIRGGLADIQSKGYAYWDAPAARMTDAQAAGLARQLRTMAGIPVSGAGWQERLLERFGLLHLIVEAYGRLDALSPELQADVRSLIGWTQKEEELLSGTGVRDRWQVLSRTVEEEDRLKTQRTWLWGVDRRKPALVMSFAFGSNSLDTLLVPNTLVDGELVYFPSAYPLRALVKTRFSASDTPANLPGYATLDDAVGAYSAALACHPWIGSFPWLVNKVIPTQVSDRWYLRDADNRVVPLSKSYDKGWQLLAFSGGHPITLFGEWDGEILSPLSAWSPGQFIHL